MELITTPDIYCPIIDDQGNYIDKIPSFHIIKKGLLCPCFSRKDKVYDNYASFSLHIKTKKHMKWLETVNLNKANYYTENIKLNETINNQRQIIAKMEKDINNQSQLINYLTEQLSKKNIHITTVNDLLDFD